VNRTCLIDGDILAYELGFSCQFTNEEGEITPSSNRTLKEKTKKLIKRIEERAGGSSSVIFFTGETNFRDDIVDDYKGTRNGDKPFHYYNIKFYINHLWECYQQEGLEADDLMSIYQCSHENTIICSRDKDLRMVPGWHYGWETGLQKEYGPTEIDSFGYLESKINAKGYINKVVGGGMLFFYAQCIMGDKVDNIEGAKGFGASKAYKILEGCKTEEEALEKVKDVYKKAYGEDWRRKLLQQGQLLWMIRELDDDNEPVMWSF
jgi:5'-3' exonuclease